MKLQAFLYILMRDHVVPGQVEKVVQDLEASSSGKDKYSFSNEYLEAYAKELAERLTQVVDRGVRVISRWHLTWRERLKLLFTGNLWLTLMTFGHPLQPVLLEVDSPRRYLHYDEFSIAATNSKETLADA